MTKDQYERGYVKLRQKNPTHPLIGVISKGYGPIACEYLSIALTESTERPSERAESLFHKKGHLVSRRAVLSNSFHDATSDQQRADISLQIGSIQIELIEVRKAIDTFKRTGRLPKASIKSNYIPVDGRSREKKLHSARTSISYFRKLLRTCKDPDKIKKYEARLTDLAELTRQLTA